VPENPNLCRECPFGLLLRVRSDGRYLRHGAPLELRVALDRRRKRYHSHCGDRFRMAGVQWDLAGRQAGRQDGSMDGWMDVAKMNTGSSFCKGSP